MTTSSVNESGLAPEAPRLLIELAQALHAAAVPSGANEALIANAARGLGLCARLWVLQSALVLELGRGPSARVALRRMDFDTHFRLAKEEALVSLARALAQRSAGVRAGLAQLERIEARPALWSWHWVLLGYVAYSAAVCVRVGAGAREVLAGALTGCVAGFVHFGTLQHPAVNLQKSFVGGFAGSLCVLALHALLPPFAASYALFGGVTLLAPAMVITIAVHELASGALEAGVIRLAYGLLRFMMLGAGIAAAAMLWGLFAAIPSARTPHALPLEAALIAVFAGGLALAICLQARPADAIWIGCAALLAYTAQQLSEQWFPAHGAPLAAAFVLGLAARGFARVGRRSPALVLVPGLFQLAPGFIGTKAVLHLLEPSLPLQETFFDVLWSALELVLGLVLALSISRESGATRPVLEAKRKPPMAAGATDAALESARRGPGQAERVAHDGRASTPDIHPDSTLRS